MLEKPRLADDKIITCVKESYGLTVTRLEFLPLGYDTYAGVYRVWAGDESYFLKVKSDTVEELSVRLPRYLKAHGLEQVVAPLPTVTGDLWGTVDHFTLILYPFIEVVEVELSDSQWIEFGAFVKALHGTQLPPDLLARMSQETFVPHPKRMATLRQLQAEVISRAYANPIQQQLAAFWQDHHPEIDTIIERSEQLGRMLQGKPLEMVLCHADIHQWNLMLDAQRALYVVDWDQPILAPRERDLMFVTVGGFVTQEREENLFLQGYGSVEIDPLVMAYYRYERVMEDLSDFAERVFLMDTNDATKEDSAAWFRVQFEPGSVLEAAHRLDGVLPL